MDKNAPIGVFDSGIGGLTVAAALSQALPREQLIYFGDTAHLPYGEKSTETVQNYAQNIARYLYAQGCKMLVIACNTASAAAYELLRQEWAGKMLIVDVINPLVAFVAQKKYKKVGVIATKATVRTDIYNKKLLENNPNLFVASLATGLLASMIEEGFVNNEISHSVIHKYLSYPDFEEIEALLLACTHYPLIKKEIEAYFNHKVAIFDSVEAVKDKVVYLLNLFNLFNTENTSPQANIFLVSDYTDAFARTAAIFYGQSLDIKQVRL